MDFGANKMPVEVIKEGAFGGTYFRDKKLYKKSMEKMQPAKRYWSGFYCSDYYDHSVNKYGVECRVSLRVWENKGWINKIDPYGWFQWYFRYWLGRRSEDHERKLIDGKNCK